MSVSAPPPHQAPPPGPPEGKGDTDPTDIHGLAMDAATDVGKLAVAAAHAGASPQAVQALQHMEAQLKLVVQAVSGTGPEGAPPGQPPEGAGPPPGAAPGGPPEGAPAPGGPPTPGPSGAPVGGTPPGPPGVPASAHPSFHAAAAATHAAMVAASQASKKP